jgi:hypothetical protein
MYIENGEGPFKVTSLARDTYQWRVFVNEVMNTRTTYPRYQRRAYTRYAATPF